MADLVGFFTDFAEGLLRPREFSEKRLAPDGFAALKAALTFAVASCVFFIFVITTMSPNARPDPFQLTYFIFMLIPVAGLLFIFQTKRGISFFQALAICVLIMCYQLTWIGLCLLLIHKLRSNPPFFVTVSAYVPVFYILGYVAP